MTEPDSITGSPNDPPSTTGSSPPSTPGAVDVLKYVSAKYPSTSLGQATWLAENVPSVGDAGSRQTWVDAAMQAFSGGAGPSRTASPHTPPRAPSDTGPPVSVHSSDGRPQGHPMSWPIELVTKMKPEEYRNAIRDFEEGASTNRVARVFRERIAAAEARKNAR